MYSISSFSRVCRSSNSIGFGNCRRSIARLLATVHVYASPHHRESIAGLASDAREKLNRRPSSLTMLSVAPPVKPGEDNVSVLLGCVKRKITRPLGPIKRERKLT